MKFGLRWYDATAGTWTQQDTLDAPLDPANANRYAYAAGDPINGSDPTGQINNTDCALAGAGLALATVGLVGAVVTGPGTGFLLTVAAVSYVGAGIAQYRSCY